MLQTLLDKSCAKFPDHAALRFTGHSYSYHQLNTLVNHLASAFIRLEIKPGDKIAVLLPNYPEAIISFMASFKVGATVVMLNPLLNHQEIIRILKESTPSLVISDTSLIFSELSENYPCYLTNADNLQNMNCHAFSSLLQPNETPVTFPDFPESSIATLAYTSGSTSNPKGVMHTYAQLYQFLVSHAELFDYTEHDCILISTPVAFGYCFSNQILPSLYAGAMITLVLTNDLASAIHAILHENVTLAYIALTKIIPWMDLLASRQPFTHHLRAIITAGDAMPAPFHERIKRLLGVNVYEGIGTTETWFYANNTVRNHKPGSMGKICSNMQVNILDDHHQPLPAGVSGEIAVKGYSVFSGYFNRPELAPIHDGWYHTGDIGYIDEDGYIWFVGRKGQLIYRNGMMIRPHEIESAIYAHSSVLETGVVGELYASNRTKVIAYIALKHACTVTDLGEIQTHLLKNLSPEKMPDEIVILEKLPKGVSGKIDRRVLTNLL